MSVRKSSRHRIYFLFKPRLPSWDSRCVCLSGGWVGSVLPWKKVFFLEVNHGLALGALGGKKGKDSGESG